LEIEEKQGYFGCLTNCISPQQIALESYANPQKTQQAFKSPMKKNWVSGFCE